MHKYYVWFIYDRKEYVGRFKTNAVYSKDWGWENTNMTSILTWELVLRAIYGTASVDDIEAVDCNRLSVHCYVITHEEFKEYRSYKVPRWTFKQETVYVE